jgi:hypothetical protein
MNINNLIITKADLISLCDQFLPVKDLVINQETNEVGYKCVTIYGVAEDVNTKEKFKVQIKYEGHMDLTFTYEPIEDEENAND